MQTKEVEGFGANESLRNHRASLNVVFCEEREGGEIDEISYRNLVY